jgi:hypothetical protein
MIIKNGLLIDPVKEITYVADLRICDGKIAEIGENLEAAEQEEGFSFYERYFSKAKTLTKEREIELRKERERASISR